MQREDFRVVVADEHASPGQPKPAGPPSHADTGRPGRAAGGAPSSLSNCDKSVRQAPVESKSAEHQPVLSGAAKADKAKMLRDGHGPRSPRRSDNRDAKLRWGL